MHLSRQKKRKQIFKLEQYSSKISVFVCARLYNVCTVSIGTMHCNVSEKRIINVCERNHFVLIQKIPSINLYLQSIRCIDLNLLAFSFSKTFTSVIRWLIKFLQKRFFQVDPAEDERSRYVQKIDSKSVSLLDYPNRCLTFTFHIHRSPKRVPLMCYCFDF